MSNQFKFVLGSMILEYLSLPEATPRRCIVREDSGVIAFPDADAFCDGSVSSGLTLLESMVARGNRCLEPMVARIQSMLNRRLVVPSDRQSEARSILARSAVLDFLGKRTFTKSEAVLRLA